MTEYLIVGAGGAIGSVVRYILGKKISAKSLLKFPLGTFIINISGAVLLGAASSVSTTGDLYLLFAVGFLGAYTTFSTFMYEGFDLLKNKKKLNAAIYIIGSLVLGFAGFMAGMGIAKLL